MGGGISAATAVKESLAKGDLQAFQSLVKIIDCVFIDEEFPPDVSILGYPKHIEDDIIWMRPQEFGSGFLFSKNDPTPGQIIHAHKTREDLSNSSMRFLSDYLVPVVSALCRRPDYLRDLFLVYNINAGLVAVQLWHNHKLETVVIDDHVPCNKYTFQPYFSSLSTGDAWLPLLEKAMAKLHGSYSNAVPTGGPRDLLRDLTGDSLTEYSCLEMLNTSQNDPEEREGSPIMSVFEIIRSKFQCGMCSLIAPSLSIDNWFLSVVDLGHLEASANSTFVTIADHAVAESRYTTSSTQVLGSLSRPSPSLAAVKLLENEVAIMCTRKKAAVNSGLNAVTAQEATIVSSKVERKKKREKRGGKGKKGMEAEGSIERNIEVGQVETTQEMHQQLAVLEELVEAKESWHSWSQFLSCRSSFYLFQFNTKKISTQLATVSGRWERGLTGHATTAVGGYHHAGWRRNPLYRLRAKHIPRFGSLVVSVCLSQPEKRSQHRRRHMQRQSQYAALGLLACKDHVLLNDITADSGGYQCQRDIYLQVTLTADSPTAVLVPSTLYPDTESDFYLTATYPIEQSDDRGVSGDADNTIVKDNVRVTLEKIDDWASRGLPFEKEAFSQWQGDSAAGRIDVKGNPFAWRNPCFKITFLDLENPLAGSYTSSVDNPLIELAVVLAPDDIKEYEAVSTTTNNNTKGGGGTGTDSKDKLLPVGYVCSACHIMTPAALGNLYYNAGYCGDMGVEDGYLGKVGYQNLPVTNRFERFRLITNDIHNNSSSLSASLEIKSHSKNNNNNYRELIVMPSTWAAGCEASFSVTFFSNTRFVVEYLDLRSYDTIQSHSEGINDNKAMNIPPQLPFPFMAPPRAIVLNGYLLDDGTNLSNAALLDLALAVHSKTPDDLNNVNNNNNNNNSNNDNKYGFSLGTRSIKSQQLSYACSSNNNTVGNSTLQKQQKQKLLTSSLPTAREVLVNSFGVSTNFHRISSRQELEEERTKQLLFKDAEKPRRKKILNPFEMNGVLLVNAKNYYAHDMPEDDQYRGLFDVKRPDYFVPMDEQKVVSLSETFRREIADHMQKYQNQLRAQDYNEEEEEQEVDGNE